MAKMKIVLSVVVALMLVQGADAVLMKFDFGPSDVAAAAGFTRVTHETVYSAAQGYGIYHHNTNFTPTSRSVNRGGVSPYAELTTFVDMSLGQRFLVDVPNGDYHVTVVAGDPGYTYYERLYINETTYGWSLANGVTPADAPLKILQHGPWQTNLETIAIPQSSWRDAGSYNVRVLGYNTGSFTDEDDKKIEYLMLDQAEITVTDGQLRIENQWGTGNKLNYVIVQSVPEPMTVVLLGLGLGFVARRKR